MARARTTSVVLSVALYFLAVRATNTIVIDGSINPDDRGRRNADHRNSSNVEVLVSVRHKMRVLVDNSGQPYHSEIVLSVMRLVQCLHPRREPHFFLDNNLARHDDDIYGGFDGFADQIDPLFASEGGQLPAWTSLSKSASMMDRIAYLNALDNDKETSYDYLVLATAAQNMAMRDPAGQLDIATVRKYASHPRVLIILHNPMLLDDYVELLRKPSVWVANNGRRVCELTSQHFSPIEQPTPKAAPLCSRPPVYVVQGALVRRSVKTLLTILKSDALKNRRFVIRHIGKLPPANHNISIGGIPASVWRKELGTSHHFEFPAHGEEFTTVCTAKRVLESAAFMLPLVSPKETSGYFHGKATSSVAYGVHYRQRFVGHSELLDE